MSFKNLKKKSMNFDELAEKLEESKSGGNKKSFQDDRFWYPKTDEAGNGYAIIRFLPPSENDELPWVKTMNHGFKGVGGWYIEPCPTVIGNECPVCSANGEVVNAHGGWDSTPDIDKKVVRDRKRKIQYIANIYIVRDPENPENEGQVRLFKFGTKIFDKLHGAAKPEFEDETPFDPFNFWEGANFKLKIRKVEGQTNYDKSEFEAPSQLLPTDDEMEAVYNKEYTLADFVAEESFKSYDDLEARFNKVVGKRNNKAQSNQAEEYDVAKEPNVGKTEDSSFEKSQPTTSSSADEDDTLAYFQQLAESY